MAVLEAAAQLDEPGEHGALREVTAATRRRPHEPALAGDHLVEIAGLREIHDDHQALVVLEHLVAADDVEVLDLLHGGDLLLGVGDLIAVGDVELLQRHLGTGRAGVVLCGVDVAEGAAADLLDDAVLLADERARPARRLLLGGPRHGGRW